MLLFSTLAEASSVDTLNALWNGTESRKHFVFLMRPAVLKEFSAFVTSVLGRLQRTTHVPFQQFADIVTEVPLSYVAVLLLEHGADANLCGPEHELFERWGLYSGEFSPLHIACRHCQYGEPLDPGLLDGGEERLHQDLDAVVVWWDLDDGVVAQGLAAEDPGDHLVGAGAGGDIRGGLLEGGDHVA